MSRGKKTYSNQFLVFLGEEVSILTDLQNSITTSSEHGTVTENYPISFQGFLLDEDEFNYYLGKTLNSINEMISKKNFVQMKLVEDLVDEIFEQMPIPKKDEDVN
jgi:hypothetical protein